MKDFKRENGKYYIKGKEVSEEAAFSMLEEELEKANKKLDSPSPLPISKLNLNPNKSPEDEIYCCPDCQEILDLIKYLSEASNEEAVGTFTDIMSKHERNSYLQGQIDAFSQMGSIGYKISSKLEISLDEMQQQDYEEDNYPID
jgi:hypothetical protein